MKTHSPYSGMFHGFLIILFILGWTQTAFAHVEGGQAAGFITGLQHP